MKRLLPLTLVLLMLMGFSACGSFTPRSDSVYIKVYNSTGCSLKSLSLDEYENAVLKSTTVAENANGSSFNPGERIVFEVLDADPSTLSFVIEAENEHGERFSGKCISAAVLRRGIIYAYSAEISDGRLVLSFLGAEE